MDQQVRVHETNSIHFVHYCMKMKGFSFKIDFGIRTDLMFSYNDSKGAINDINII